MTSRESVPSSRWVLAFDSSCGSCRRLSERIRKACSGRLETVPLNHPEAVEWRQATLGEDAEWKPVLFRVTVGSVRAWTGRSMVFPLLRHLGPVSSVKVTYALGGLRNELTAAHNEEHGRGVTRKKFLQFGAGTAIAGTLIIRGQLPAYASDPAGAWVRANAHKLPTTYDDFVGYPLDYRRAIYRQITPQLRSAFWREQFDRYRASNPDLTGDQSAVLAAARSAATPAGLSAPRRAPSAWDVDFGRRARDAFGYDEAAALFTVLGSPAEPRTAHREAPHGAASALRDCNCSQADPWCGTVIKCQFDFDCSTTQFGCGTLGLYACTGLCDS